jgi:uncharacterized protein (DUF736 family)
MESKNKLNSGAIFKNSKKTSEKSPDYKGTVNVNGKDMEISLWFKESQKGTKYFSALFQEPFKKENQVMTKPNSFGIANDSNFRIDSHDDLF